MIPTGVSILQERELPILLPKPEAGTSELVRCFRHEGEHCPRCDGSGFRPRKYCVGCGQLSGKPSEGSKALQPSRAAKSWEEVRTLPLYCRECNPRFAPLEAAPVALQKIES